MHKLIRIMLSAAFGLGVTTAAMAQDHGTKAEAQAMVQAAVAHVQKVGPEQAFKAFTEDKTAWVKKDLYVVAIRHDGMMMAHGVNAKLVGKPQIELQDATGREFVRDLIKTSKADGSGWIDYEWAHPQTKKIAPKSLFVTRLPNFDGFVGVGVYR